MKLGFIGTGNMAGAIMGGIIKNGVLKQGEKRYILFMESV